MPKVSLPTSTIKLIPANIRGYTGENGIPAGKKTPLLFTGSMTNR